MSEGQAAAPAAQVQAPAPAAADPISRIQAMLDSERAPASNEHSQNQTEEGEQSSEEEYIPDGSNKSVEGEEQQEEAGEDEEGNGEEKRAIAEIPLDQLESIQLEVTTKGEDGRDVLEKPTIKELREGYMRTKDYSRKTAELARQREEVGTKTRQAIDSERTQYLQNLKVLHDTLIETVAPELRNVDWDALATNDAFEFVRLRNRADKISRVLGEIQSETQNVTKKQQAERNALTREQAIKARETLERDIPGFDDTMYQTLMNTAKEYGFDIDEVAQWVDPRPLKVLHDAYQFRQMKKPAATKKVAVAPKVLRSGSANVQGQNQQRGTDALKRLQGSGSINDAAAVIRSRMR